MKDIDFNIISEKIKSIRISKGITQEALAKAIDVNPSHICNIENGRAKVSLQSLILIADALNVSVDSLLADVREKPEDTYSLLIIDKIAGCTLAQKRRLLKFIELFTSDDF